MRPSLMKLTRSLPPVSKLDQVPATVVCTGWGAPASARKNAAVITTPVMARIDKNVVLVRRGRPVDWFNMLVIRFVLSFFFLFVVRHSRLTGSLFTGSYNEAVERLQSLGNYLGTCGLGSAAIELSNEKLQHPSP